MVKFAYIFHSRLVAVAAAHYLCIKLKCLGVVRDGSFYSFYIFVRDSAL